ncbi:MAG: hypothetical protein ACPL3C_06770, partial [Pyrobaculum sp.]
EGWVDQNGNTYKNATITIQVNQPMRLTATWAKDYTEAAALGVGVSASGLLGWRRKEVTRVINTLTRRREVREELEVQPYAVVETRVREEDKTAVRTTEEEEKK